MNVTILLVLGLLAAPPLGYLTYQTLDADRSVLAASEPADAAPAAPVASAETPREPERHEGVQHITLQVGAPYPTCPTSCTFGYSFFETGALEFEVPEGATRVEVRAIWDAPVVPRLAVSLYVEDGCGEGCWRGVARGEGAGEASFAHDSPAAATYRVSAHGTGPVVAVVQQDVRLEAVVHFS